jgi:signal transduction histidine kinase
VEELALQFFPYPHVFKGKRREGLLVPWAPPCASSDRQCERSTEAGLQLCSYGVNFQRVDDDLLIAGIVVRDYPSMTEARKKVLSRVGKQAVTRQELEIVLEAAQAATAHLEAELRSRKDRIILDYKETAGYQTDIVEQLRPEIQEALGQVHDYKQFVQQVIQNLNVILGKRYPAPTVEEQLAQASHELQAIYWAARLMEEKLDAALFLIYPERIEEARDQKVFRFHGMVTKYRKIYERQMESRGLKLALEGEVRDYFILGNPRAISIIPHAFIDNAIKYAPRGTEIVLSFAETDDRILFSVRSYGPLIHTHEARRIFDIFFRGREAVKIDSEGTGFGLASAQAVAKAVGTEIKYRQEDKEGPSGTRWTEFSVAFDKAPERERAPRPDRRREERRR